MAYKGYYYCRLCDKNFCTCMTGSKKTVMECLYYVTDSILTPEKLDPLRPEKMEIHFCEDGSRGVADFLGYKKEEL